MASVYGDMTWNEEECAELAEQLKNAMDGLGTEEETIIRVLVDRNNAQRQDIAKAYEQAYGKPLVDDLVSELTGDLEEVIVAMMMKPREYDATMLYNAIQGGGTDESTLICVLCTRPNNEIEEIRACYKEKFDSDLVDDLAGDTSGYFGRMMRSLVNGNREEDDHGDDAAAEDAQKLIDAGIKQLGTDECDFNSVLCTRSYRQLRRIMQQYTRLTDGQDLKADIESEMSGSLKEGYLSILECAKDKSSFFATRLNKAMRGWGTDDSELIRLIVSRCETDLVWIQEKYQKMYDVSLYEDVTNECSGYYKKCLLSLIKGHYIG